jgi:hypothetical protein
MGAERLDQLTAHQVSLSPVHPVAIGCCHPPAARWHLFSSRPGLLRKILRDIEVDWDNLQKNGCDGRRCPGSPSPPRLFASAALFLPAVCCYLFLSPLPAVWIAWRFAHGAERCVIAARCPPMRPCSPAPLRLCRISSPDLPLALSRLRLSASARIVRCSLAICSTSAHTITQQRKPDPLHQDLFTGERRSLPHDGIAGGCTTDL